MRVLVVGGTGYLGRFVVQEALSRGHAVRAIARSAARARLPEAVEVVEADVTQAGALAGVAAGCDAVFSSLGITRQADGQTYDQVDLGGNLAVLREAERAGAARFVYVSVLHPEHTRHTDLVAAKERFVDALRQSAIPAPAVVRPTGFFSDMSEVLEMARSGRAWVLGGGAARINPIHGADLARVCVDVLEDERSEVEVGGPEIFTQRQIAALAFEALGRPPAVTSLPEGVATLALAGTRLVSRRWWNIGAFMVAACTHDMVGPCAGAHRLADHFATEAARAPTSRG
jgi:uncharacterized protein YbjT (DUF2867 family)